MSGETHGVYAPTASLPDLLDIIRHRARLEILVSLAHAPKDVSTLADEQNLAVHRISRHLRPLYGWGLVRYDCIDKHHVYRLGRQILRTVCGDALHLLIKTTQGQSLVLRFPANAVVRWDPPSASIRSRSVPNRSGG